MKTTQIEWHTGEPPEDGVYIVTAIDRISQELITDQEACFQNGRWCGWGAFNEDKVIAWAYPIDPYNGKDTFQIDTPVNRQKIVCPRCRYYTNAEFGCQLGDIAGRELHQFETGICSDFEVIL